MGVERRYAEAMTSVRLTLILFSLLLTASSVALAYITGPPTKPPALLVFLFSAALVLLAGVTAYRALPLIIVNGLVS